MNLTGENIIGARRVAGGEARFRAIDAATGQPLEPDFAAAGPEEAGEACRLAGQAFDAYREISLDRRAGFLETIAAEIEALGEPLILRAMAESGLPRARLEGERGRTTGQLRLFAEVVRQGDFIGARIDPALPERKPAPRADLRQRMIALGPVAVFGASNFPLAFSVAGGDTASALAAGCPVVVKGHPAHPGTSELVGAAIARAAETTGMPDGVFSLLTGPSNALGEALVADPSIKAVGFTGSRAGGLALAAIAEARPQPIPVYAEMSSINPVILLPAALGARAEALAKGFAGSVMLGAGQFCTNPGLVLALDGPDLDRFVEAAGAELGGAPSAVMLTPAIRQAFETGVARLAACESVRQRAGAARTPEPNQAAAALFETRAEAFLADPVLHQEVFGAASLVVRCPTPEALIAVLEALEGQLTATLHLDEADHPLAARLLPILERKVGRILANGWPTGVEVCHAMVHGGPFPATSDSRSTSVGTLAIARFLRPVCYQDLPDDLLPPALRPSNPLALTRMIDGQITLAAERER